MLFDGQEKKILSSKRVMVMCIDLYGVTLPFSSQVFHTIFLYKEGPFQPILEPGGLLLVYGYFKPLVKGLFMVQYLELPTLKRFKSVIESFSLSFLDCLRFINPSFDFLMIPLLFVFEVRLALLLFYLP